MRSDVAELVTWLRDVLSHRHVWAMSAAKGGLISSGQWGVESIGETELARARQPGHPLQRGDATRVVDGDGDLVAVASGYEVAGFLGWNDPGFADDDTAVKRLLLDGLERDLDGTLGDETAAVRVKLLAYPYRREDGYRMEWLPEGCPP